MVSHVLFDFFGTLVEYSASRSEQGYARSFDLLARAGTRLDYEGFLSLWTRVADDFDRAAEQSKREFSMVELGCGFLDQALPAPPPDAFVREFVELYVEEWNKGVHYPDGIQRLLERMARQFELAVITNTHDADLVPRHLARMGVSSLFKTVVTSVEFGMRKPDPSIFQHTLDSLGVSAGDCVYVGDNLEADYEGGRAAGIRALLIDPRGDAGVPESARLRSIFELEGSAILRAL